MTGHDYSHLRLLRKAYAPTLDSLVASQLHAVEALMADAFVAGLREGHALRASAPPRILPGVESRRTRVFWRAMELAASCTTLAGMWVGSTTVVGSLWYLAAGVAFTAVSFKRRLHSLQPLNFAALAIEAWNLWSALR